MKAVRGMVDQINKNHINHRVGYHAQNHSTFYAHVHHTNKHT
jgi:hypothetical protein